ncbi:hypothetical protein DL96DRAFT_1628634 [Flagelloscypha sp. PMI_526]|nr:hypothetical protein DL96DRAFT_1628634 [Flagelloscypha sp. PMI_526]
MLFLVLLSAFVAVVAADCPLSRTLLRAFDANTGSQIGMVSTDLNSSGSFGITNSTNMTHWAQISTWNDCKNQFPFYIQLENTRDPHLNYTSLVSGFRNCSDATMPGWLLMTPSDGPGLPYPTPNLLLSTLQHGWNSPPTPFCGETWGWEVDSDWYLIPNWINPDRREWRNLRILYDSAWDRIVFTSGPNDYPGVATPIKLQLS